jgi:peptide chain release factor 2
MGQHAAAPVLLARRAQGFAPVEDETPGDTAGIKSATIKVEGSRLRPAAHRNRTARCAEPFDSSGGRHTSFARFVYPEIDDTIEIDINPADARTDTFRASGGGQHINKTDSAVRLTHIPTGIVASTDGRSQQQPRRGRNPAQPPARPRCASARKSSRLEDTKTDVGWGHQIRSYVLTRADQGPGTNYETSATQC